MVKEKRYLSGSSIIIVLIAVLITAKIVRSYEISLLPSTLITITIAVILWYGFNFLMKKLK
ncbi:hypothetical protein [Psychrobacter frigidicola]|uniref:hypothetical protein n=1 Tax=Psychrobacter frigidicola TaxID=45611 RepID=UPI001918D8DD|nr:hypothetical protein [Psychrobacter frigidicola]